MLVSILYLKLGRSDRAKTLSLALSRFLTGTMRKMGNEQHLCVRAPIQTPTHSPTEKTAKVFIKSRQSC